MNFFKFKYLLLLLVFVVINVYLSEHWTVDKGWIFLMIAHYGIASIAIWLSVSFISYFKKAQLKNQFLFYLGIGIWQTLLTISYFNVQAKEDNTGDILFWASHLAIIIFCILPIKKLWTYDY